MQSCCEDRLLIKHVITVPLAKMFSELTIILTIIKLISVVPAYLVLVVYIFSELTIILTIIKFNIHYNIYTDRMVEYVTINPELSVLLSSTFKFEFQVNLL